MWAHADPESLNFFLPAAFKQFVNTVVASPNLFLHFDRGLWPGRGLAEVAGEVDGRLESCSTCRCCSWSSA